VAFAASSHCLDGDGPIDPLIYAKPLLLKIIGNLWAKKAANPLRRNDNFR
jgi:hypothetical protein